MRNAGDPIEAAAEYICVELHPAELRSTYVVDMCVGYYAEGIIDILQALSWGMTALFVGLLTNYLYDKATKKHEIKERQELKWLIAEQKKNIKELEKLLQHEKEEAVKRRASLSLTLHKEVLVKVESNDPSLTAMPTKAISELDQKGKDKLFEHVDSFGRGRDLQTYQK